MTYYKVYGSRASGTVPAANPDGTCKTTGLVASTDGYGIQIAYSVTATPNFTLGDVTGGFELIPGFFIAWNRLYIIVFCLMVLLAIVAAAELSTGSHSLNGSDGRDW